MIKTKEEIKIWLDHYKVKNYHINDDLTVDVNGDIHLANKLLKELPIQFGKVHGTVYIGLNELTSFKGIPYWILGHLNCDGNKITNFDFCPNFIGGLLICSNNPIKSLKGFNSEINGELYHSVPINDPNKIVELEHLYKKKRNNDFEYFYVSVSKDEIKTILSYVDLNESLPSENTTFVKKNKV